MTCDRGQSVLCGPGWEAGRAGGRRGSERGSGRRTSPDLPRGAGATLSSEGWPPPEAAEGNGLQLGLEAKRSKRKVRKKKPEGGRATLNDAQRHKQPTTGQKPLLGRRQTEMTLLTLVWGQPAPCLNVDCTSDRWRFIYKFHVFDTGPSLDSLLWVSASWPLPPPPSARLAACHADPRCHQPCWPGHAQQGTWRSLRLLDCLRCHRCACLCGGCGARLSSPGPGRQVLTPRTMSHRHPNGTGHVNAFAAVGHCAEW